MIVVRTRILFLSALSLLAATGLRGQFEAAPAPEVQQDSLDLRFANGIAAIVEDRIITVEDIRREIAPLIPQLIRTSRDEQEFNERLEALQDNTIQDIVDRVLMIKEFRKDGKMGVPPTYVDSEISDRIFQQFDNDRSRFLAYLRSRGLSIREYRREVEEDLIYSFMHSKMARSQSIISPVKVEEFYKQNHDRFYQEDSVHLRLIQLSRTPGETDEALQQRAAEVVSKVEAGTSFAEIAQQVSNDSRRSKGGDWGWQKRSDLRKEFSDALFSLEKGQHTKPILTPEAAFVLYVEDRKVAGVQPIDEVRGEIERILANQMAIEAQERWLERLRRDGYVKYY